MPGIVLAFDTSAAHCAAALVSGGALIEARTEPMDKGQAERLMPMLQEMLGRNGLGWNDVGLIGVGCGPGNFTGVRLAVSAARGLALALGVPAIGVTTLEAHAHGQPRPIAVVEDARRGAMYLQVFGTDADGIPQLVSERDLAELTRGLALAGPAASAVAALTGGRFLPPVTGLAEAIARIAEVRGGRPQPRPTVLYLRPPDAAPAREPAPELLS